MSVRRSTPESAVLKSVILWLRAAGFLAYRNNSGRLRDRNGRPVSYGLGVGSPDVVAIFPPDSPHPGRFLAVECKAGKNRLTPAQESWLAEAAGHGAVCVVARGIDDLARQLAPFLERTDR